MINQNSVQKKKSWKINDQQEVEVLLALRFDHKFCTISRAAHQFDYKLERKGRHGETRGSDLSCALVLFFICDEHKNEF